MEYLLYGETKTADEVREFVTRYRDGLLADQRQRYHAIVGLLPQGVRLLDYGCGWGVNALGAWEGGNAVTGIDLSQNEIDICNLLWQGREGLQFKHARIAEFDDGEFECVLSNQVIEHVHNVGHYLTGINRVLADDGTLLISTPGGATPRNFHPLLRPEIEASLRALSVETIAGYNKTHDHIHSWDQRHFVRLLGSCGFELQRYVPAEGIPLPWSWKRKFGGNGYLYPQRGRWRHMCRTMVFLFRKVVDVRIECDE